MGTLSNAARMEVWQIGKQKKTCFTHLDRFDMAGGRDWLYVETDQPHSTRVIELILDLLAIVKIRWIGGKKIGK